MPCIKEHNKVQQFDGQNLGKKTIFYGKVSRFWIMSQWNCRLRYSYIRLFNSLWLGSDVTCVINIGVGGSYNLKTLPFTQWEVKHKYLL